MLPPGGGWGHLRGLCSPTVGQQWNSPSQMDSVPCPSPCARAQGCRRTIGVTQRPPTEPTHSRSSSKCVSIPSGPGTEQTSRAFRKVLHLFTRQQCPPSSFCVRGTQQSAPHSPPPAPACTPPTHCTHQADAPDAGIDPGAERGIRRLLPEEEVEFVIIPLAAVRDELGTDEGRVCKGTTQCCQPGNTHSPRCCKATGATASPRHPSACAQPVLTAPPPRSLPRQPSRPAGPPHLLCSVYSAAALGPGVLYGGRKSAQGH